MLRILQRSWLHSINIRKIEIGRDPVHSGGCVNRSGLLGYAEKI